MILRSSSGQQVVLPDWLSLCASEPSLMFQIRRLLYETSAATHIHLLSDHDILECVERMMRNGEFQVVQAAFGKKAGTGGTTPKPEVAAPRPSATPRPSQREPEPEPHTFDSSLDGARQAQALAAASSHGAAFCEA